MTAGGVGLKHAAQLVPNLAEGLKFRFRAPFGPGRIVKGPVMPVHLAGEHGAGLAGIVADGDDGLDFLVQEFGQRLGTMPGNVDPDFGHDLDGDGVDEAGWFRPGALDVDQPSRRAPQDAFGQVTATGIAGAENQDGRFSGVHSDAIGRSGPYSRNLTSRRLLFDGEDMNRINRIHAIVLLDHDHDSAAHRHKLRMRHRQFSPIRKA